MFRTTPPQAVTPTKSGGATTTRAVIVFTFGDGGVDKAAANIATHIATDPFLVYVAEFAGWKWRATDDAGATPDGYVSGVLGYVSGVLGYASVAVTTPARGRAPAGRGEMNAAAAAAALSTVSNAIVLPLGEAKNWPQHAQASRGGVPAAARGARRGASVDASHRGRRPPQRVESDAPLRRAQKVQAQAR